jgi:hypothetical protein
VPSGLPSELASLAFLSILLLVAFIVAGQGGRPLLTAGEVIPPACLTLALQALHVIEEFATGFHRRAPAMLGFEPWSPVYFVAVNLAAIALWLLAFRALSLGRANRAWRTLLWFLAIASVGNAFWHPLVSLATAAYFPGTVTAPFLGVAGFLLARALTGRGPGRARPATEA